MKPRSDDELRNEYQDLELRPDEGELRVVRVLDAGYRSMSPPPPPSLRSPSPAPGAFTGKAGKLKRPGIRLRSRTLIGLALAAALVTAGGVAWALSTTYLGKPTSAEPYYIGLGNFHKIKTFLHVGPKPELLFIGADLHDEDEAERWPVIKALDQFGSFSGVKIWPNFCQPGHPCDRTFPGFDMSHATYRSRYVAFVHKDSEYPFRPPLARLSPIELKLFNAYANPDGPKTPLVTAEEDAANNYDRDFGKGLPQSAKALPLVVVGDYAQTQPIVPLNSEDFRIPRPTPTPCPNAYCASSGFFGAPATFDQVQQSLATGRAVGGLPQTLVDDVNAETNVIITLVCHADHNQPKSVCSRPVIKKLLKRVK